MKGKHTFAAFLGAAVCTVFGSLSAGAVYQNFVVEYDPVVQPYSK